VRLTQCRRHPRIDQGWVGLFENPEQRLASLPERYSVFVRFTRLSKIGVWDAAFEALASLGPPADREHAIDSTIVRAHQHAAGVKGGIKIKKRSAVRAAGSRPRSTSVPTPKATR
jgi:transposase